VREFLLEFFLPKSVSVAFREFLREGPPDGDGHNELRLLGDGEGMVTQLNAGVGWSSLFWGWSFGGINPGASGCKWFGGYGGGAGAGSISSSSSTSDSNCSKFSDVSFAVLVVSCS
jgi:hypothetical protein